MKKLYLLTQDVNGGYDTFDSAVVCAESADEAKLTKVGSVGAYGSWAAPEHVTVQEIGTALDSVEIGVVLASFNAG